MSTQFKINEQRRFLILCACISGSFCAAFVYLFSLAGGYIKTHYGLTQSHMTTITTVGKSIAWIMFPIGLVFDHLGPIPLFAAATCILSISSLLFGLTFDGYLKGSVGGFTAFYAIMAVGASCFDLGSTMAGCLNFPRNRGAVVVTAKTLTGLGSSFLAIFYSGWFKGRYNHFMYFCTGLTIVMGIFCSTFLLLPPYVLNWWNSRHLTEEEKYERRLTALVYERYSAPQSILNIAYGITYFSIIYLASVSLLEAFIKLSSTTMVILAVIAAFTLASYSLMCVPLSFYQRVFGGCFMKDKLRDDEDDTNLEEGPYSSDTEGPQPGDIIEINGFKERILFETPRYDQTFLQNLLYLRFWALWWTGLSCWGTGYVILYNSPQIFRALADYTDSKNAMVAALIGVGTAIARVSCGLIEQRFMKRHDYKRYMSCILYPLAPGIQMLAFILFLVLRGDAVVLAFVCLAFGNGVSWAVTPMLVPSMYTRCAGTVYIYCYTGGMVGLVILNRVMFGTLFDQEMRHQNLPDKTCKGSKCIRTSALVCLFINLSAVLASMYVVWHYYRHVMGLVKVTQEDITESLTVESFQSKESDIDDTYKKRVLDDNDMIVRY